jgi:hypothetical protein
MAGVDAWLLNLLVNSHRLITYKGGGPPQHRDFPGL